MVVYVDIQPRGPTVCASMKNYSVCERTASICKAYARCTQHVSYAYVKVCKHQRMRTYEKLSEYVGVR